jgi:hypothetical protein
MLFGVETVVAGFDSWHGIVTGSTFLAGFLLLVALDLIKPAPLARSLVMVLAGVAVLGVTGYDLWEMFRGPQITSSSVSGDTEVLGGLAKAMTQVFVSGMRAEPLPGPFVACALGGGLLVLGLIQLGKTGVRARRSRLHRAETPPPEAPRPGVEL